MFLPPVTSADAARTDVAPDPIGPARLPGSWPFFAGNLLIGSSCLLPPVFVAAAFLNAFSGRDPLSAAFLPVVELLIPLVILGELVGRGLCFSWYRSAGQVGLAVSVIAADVLLIADRFLFDSVVFSLVLWVLFAGLEAFLFYQCGQRAPRPLTILERTTTILATAPVIVSVFVMWVELEGMIVLPFLLMIPVGLTIGWVIGRGISHIRLAIAGRPETIVELRPEG